MRKETMNNGKLILERLTTVLQNTPFTAAPRAPLKFAREEETTVEIRLDGKAVCGIQAQVRDGIKMWFYDHPEWELETEYPVKRAARNGNGLGSGKGFYVDTIEESIEEAKTFLKKKYNMR